MTIRHFKIFTAVCDTMNMTSAAEKLYISQSAVSQAISELEEHYKVKLFERLSRKLYLTQAGRELLGYARHMLQMNTEIENNMKMLNEVSSIRLGASVTVGAYVLPKLVSGFNKANPKTNITAVEDNTSKIEKLILHDDIDIGLVEGETTSPDVLSRTFMNDELVLICGAGCRFAGLNEIEPHELEKEKFIIREKGSGTRKTFENMMELNGLTWKASWVCNNADTIKMAVAEGLGVSVISRRAVTNELKSKMLFEVPIKGMQFKRQFKIIYHKSKYLTEPMKKFIDFCQKAFNE